MPEVAEAPARSAALIKAARRVTVKVGSSLPIVNENATVATQELRYGDDDRLCARVAQMIQSDLLILLSGVDGVYAGEPRRDAAATHVPHIASLDEEVEAWAGAASARGLG